MVFTGMRKLFDLEAFGDRIETLWTTMANQEASLEQARVLLKLVEQKLGQPFDLLADIDLSRLDAKALSETIKGLLAVYLATYGLDHQQLALSANLIHAKFLQHLAFLRKLG
jgi:hypothetical protein